MNSRPKIVAILILLVLYVNQSDQSKSRLNDYLEKQASSHMFMSKMEWIQLARAMQKKKLSMDNRKKIASKIIKGKGLSDFLPIRFF